MVAYRTNVLTFDQPENWQDQSITAFRIPAASGGSDASFVVTRDDGKGVKDFAAYVAEQIQACSHALPDFALIKSEPMAVGGRAAHWAEFTWKKDGAPLQLRQIYFDCIFFATICTLTSTPRDIGFVEPAWQRLMSSVTFDRPEAVPVFPKAR